MHKDSFTKEKMLRGIRESQKHKESNRIKAKMILENKELNKKRLFFMRKSKSSEKHRMKISGDGNPMWKGGLSFEPYTPEFNPLLKSKVRKRDNYICQVCGISENGFKLDIHHIDYDKQNNDLLNLISLCKKCHSRTNTKRKYWKEHFKRIKD